MAQEKHIEMSRGKSTTFQVTLLFIRSEEKENQLKKQRRQSRKYEKHLKEWLVIHKLVRE